MMVFWIVLILAILFVVGSVTAMRYFDKDIKKVALKKEAAKKDLDK